MKLIISSKNKNLISFNGKSLFLDCSFVSLDIEKDCYFYVYPVDSDRNLIPFAVFVKMENEKLFSESRHVKTTVFPDYLELELLPFFVPDEKMPCLVNEFLCSSQSLKTHVEIFDCKKNNLSINVGQQHFYDSLFGCEESSISSVENYIIISYKAGEHYYIYIFDTKNGKRLLHCGIAQFELNESEKKLTIIEKLNDSLSHGRIIDISLTENFKAEDAGLIYLNGSPEIICKEIAFFDCIKAGNFKLAQSLMTLELKCVLTQEAASKYFENYSKILQSKIDFKFYLLDGLNSATEIVFEMKDNLINNLKILYNS